MPRSKRDLTTPDLVLLSLLCERPMHGYEANAELERRQARDWAGISRPQIYYSLEKLATLGMIRSDASGGPAQGPERRVFATTAAGRTALIEALKRPEWTTARDRPPFLTWMALSWLAAPSVARSQVEARRAFLQEQLRHERRTLRAVEAEVGHPHHEAVWMLQLIIRQFETELAWLRQVKADLARRAPARNPPGHKPQSG